MMRKIKLTRANKSITLKALAPYYYRERALGHSTQEVGKLVLKIDSLPADKKATFSAEEIHLMRTTINQLRNKRLAKGQYTDAADDMLLKLCEIYYRKLIIFLEVLKCRQSLMFQGFPAFLVTEDVLKSP